MLCIYVIEIFQRKDTNIPSQEPSECCRLGRQMTSEDVYHHLHEVEECEDIDNYDYACAATSDMRDSNGYICSNVHQNNHSPISSENMNS